MSDEEVSRTRKRSVTIFGAGVAGLTVAHELVERGFDVEVIDPDIREEILTFTRDRGIGGMARSQWACWLEALPRRRTAHVTAPPRLENGDEYLLNDVVVFDPVSRDPADPVYAAGIFDRAARLVRRLIRADDPSGPDPERASELMIMAPTTPGTPPNDYRVEHVKKALAERLGPFAGAVDYIEVEHPDPAVLQVPNQPAAMDQWIFFVLPDLNVFPSEHGFRFFPSFYRHLFDTLKRVPILNPKPHERTIATVRGNLVPCDGLGFARKGAVRSFLIQRSAVTSAEALRNYLRLVLAELDYSLSDIDRFATKMFKYMTSCTERREAEYEDISWATFVELKKYSRVSREHIEYGPQMSAALRGSKSDARTQGNISVQLMMDQFRTDGQADFTLNGPTNPAWFDHWHDYLSMQGVRFRRGTLTGFHVVDGKVLPRVFRNVTRNDDGEFVPDPASELTARGRYFVLALSLPAAVKAASAFLAVADLPPDNDFERTIAFAPNLDEDLKLAVPVGPLQHLSGIQFYFEVDVSFWRGHTQYLDSEWGLTSIAQPQFWGRRVDRTDAYRGILSVDIGIWDRNYKGKIAWDCTTDEIAVGAWEQIRDHHDDAFVERYGRGARLPSPIAYAFDANIIMTTPKTDTTPFLVNRVGAYRKRPGRLVGDGHVRHRHSHEHWRHRHPHEHCDDGEHRWESKLRSRYHVYLDRYVLVGTFMKTYTRLTSMEGANESARHGVNALLEAAKVPCELCGIWDPEDNEIADLQWLRDLDRKRFKDNMPHFIDTLSSLEAEEIDRALLLL